LANYSNPYNVIDARGLRNKLQQLTDRNASLTNQIDRVRDFVQQTLFKIKKIGSTINKPVSYVGTDNGMNIGIRQHDLKM
jgi:hypothetical protein